MARFPSILLLVLLAAGCNRPAPLTNTHASAVALANALAGALDARDRAALAGLALSEQEFREHVWPEMPAARPERNLPFSYVWGDLRQKSDAALGRTLAEHGGERLQVSRVTFDGETAYPSYTVHREAIVWVRDAAGAERALRLCGSMIEKDGAWKVFSYVADE